MTDSQQSRDAMVKLDLDVAFCSSEDSFFRADEICRTGSGVNRGWHSKAGAEAPHQLGIRMAGDCFIDRLQIIAHDSKIPAKVEVHVAEPSACNIRGAKVATYHDATFRLLGYFAFRRNEQGARCGELKCISLGCRALYIKLVMHEPHEHLLNVSHQVGLLSVAAMGHTKVPLPGTSLKSLPTGAPSSADMDMLCDPTILAKIRIFDSSKRKAVADEDLESARRINLQIDVMIPLAIQTKTLEQQKEFAIASNDFDKAQKLKAQLQRIRTFVHSLKVGMPLEEGFTLDRFDEYVSGQLYRSPSRRQTADNTLAVSQSHMEMSNAGNNSPAVGRSASSSSMVLVEDDEVALEDDDLTPHDAAMKQKIGGLLKDKQLKVEHVSHARASRIHGWEDANRAFGLYFACCLFSKNHAIREAAIKILTTDGFKLFSELAGGSAPFYFTAVGSYLASTSYGSQESVQSTLIANVDLICGLASEALGGAAGSASLLRVSEQLCTTLLVRSAESNKRVKEAALKALRALASCATIGLDRVCAAILEVEIKKNFRLLLAKTEFLLAELSDGPTWIDFPSLAFANIATAVLKPTIEGVSPEVRSRGADLFGVVLRACGTDSSEVRKFLKALRPSQLAAVEAAYGSKIPLDETKKGKTSPSRGAAAAASPKRRTVADTLSQEPDLGNVYKFSSRTPVPKKASVVVLPRSSTAEPSMADQRVTMSSSVEDVPSKRASSIRQKLTGAVRDSRMPSRPPRRQQPRRESGKCQFCHEPVPSDDLLEHFMSVCPMMCRCPLCLNPVEVLDIHWHLAEDCQYKSQIHQCQMCFDCFKPGEYSQHTAVSACTPYDHAVIVCPLCQMVMPRDDLFWEDHMLQEPFCEKNPRRQVSADMEPEDAEPVQAAKDDANSPKTTTRTGDASNAVPLAVSAPPSAEGPPRTNAVTLENLIDDVDALREKIRAASEIGSPSDADLSNVETLKGELAVAKKKLVSLLQPLVEAERRVTPRDAEGTVEFFATLVEETDIPDGNKELVLALLNGVNVPWTEKVEEREHLLVAATDGSVGYVTILLDVVSALPDEVILASFYNQSVRMELAWVLFSTVEVAPAFEENPEMRSELQQFFEAIASKKRAIPKERQGKREDLLTLLVSYVGGMLQYDVEGSDGQTVLTRALAEGDLFVATLVLEQLRSKQGFDINKPKTDNSTALMQAVFGNFPGTVKLLLDSFGGNISRAIPPGSDFPGADVLDMAQQLQRHPSIVEMLRAPQPLSEAALLIAQKTEDID